MDKTCKTCRYCEVRGSLGLCRKNPPYVNMENGYNAVWPEVDTSDWCGEFRPVTLPTYPEYDPRKEG